MSAKHTPGPWANAGPLGHGIVINSSDRPIAVVYGPNSDHKYIANANLIAAAPDLLAALEGLRLECLADPLNPCLLGWKVGKPVQHWGSTPEQVVQACSSCIARAAIAKAKAGHA